MNMDRRKFLCGAATGLGFVTGCVSDESGSGPEPTADDQRPSATTRVSDGKVQRRVSLASVDEVPNKYSLNIKVELLESTVTATHTARLRVTTTNKGKKRQISIGKDRCSIFNRNKGKSTPPGLWLYSPEDAENFERNGHRWKRDRDPNAPQGGFPGYECNSPVYATGDSVTSKYLVWDDFRAEGYMEPETYRFETKIFFYPPNDASETPSTAAVTWGFALAVKNPTE